MVFSQDGEMLVDLKGPVIVARRRGRARRSGKRAILSNHGALRRFAEQGEVARSTGYNLELKLEADVALIGFPNVGKSRSSRAFPPRDPRSPTIPSRPSFPNLAWCAWVSATRVAGDATEFVMADIPV